MGFVMIERKKLRAVLAGAMGGALAIAAMEMYSATAQLPLVAIPFATSIVLVMGSPQAEPAQPRALVGGHLVSTAVGLLAVKLLGPDVWVAAGAVVVTYSAGAVAAASCSRCRPPSGSRPSLRRWNASSVERWPIEMIAAAGSRSWSSR